MPSVLFHPDHRLWLLRSPTSAYAIRLAKDDSVQHVHWGAVLTLDQAVELAERVSPAASSFEALADVDELAVEGGARFGPPSLLVRFADGTRGVEWRYTGHDIDGGHLRVHLRDRHYPLYVTLNYRVHGDSDVIERWTTVENRDDEAPVTVLRCDSAAWTAPHRTRYRMNHLVGGWNSEFQVRRTDVPVAETVLTSRRGAAKTAVRLRLHSSRVAWPSSNCSGSGTCCPANASCSGTSNSKSRPASGQR